MAAAVAVYSKSSVCRDQRVASPPPENCEVPLSKVQNPSLLPGCCYVAVDHSIISPHLHVCEPFVTHSAVFVFLTYTCKNLRNWMFLLIQVTQHDDLLFYIMYVYCCNHADKRSLNHSKMVTLTETTFPQPKLWILPKPNQTGFVPKSNQTKPWPERHHIIKVI